jgi:hypothetical protein
MTEALKLGSKMIVVDIGDNDYKVLNRMETQFDNLADAAYDEHCKRMILMSALEDILADGTCTANIREIAEYAIGLVDDKKSVD